MLLTVVFSTLFALGALPEPTDQIVSASVYSRLVQTTAGEKLHALHQGVALEVARLTGVVYFAEVQRIATADSRMPMASTINIAIREFASAEAFQAWLTDEGFPEQQTASDLPEGLKRFGEGDIAAGATWDIITDLKLAYDGREYFTLLKDCQSFAVDLIFALTGKTIVRQGSPVHIYYTLVRDPATKTLTVLHDGFLVPIHEHMLRPIHEKVLQPLADTVSTVSMRTLAQVESLVPAQVRAWMSSEELLAELEADLAMLTSPESSEPPRGGRGLSVSAAVNMKRKDHPNRLLPAASAAKKKSRVQGF